MKLYKKLFDISISLKPLDEYNSKTISTIKKNRVLHPILKSNQQLKIENTDWKLIEKKSEKTVKELKRINELFAKENLEYIFIKGFAMQKYYPEDIPRQSLDYDIIVRDENEFWKMSNILIEEGYENTYMPLLTKKNGKLYGLAKYEKKIDDEVYIYLEINIRGFLINTLNWFEHNDIWDRRQIKVIDQTVFKIPSAELSLIFLLIEISTRKQPFIRDIVDFYFINKHCELDWDYVYNMLPNKYFSLYTNLLKILVRRPNYIPIFKFKIIDNLFSIFPSLIKSKSLTKLTYYIIYHLSDFFVKKDKFLIFIKDKVDLNIQTKKLFDMGFLIHMVPVNLEKKGDFKFIKINNFDILRTPLGHFLLSNFCIHEVEEINLICEAINNLSGDDNHE